VSASFSLVNKSPLLTVMTYTPGYHPSPFTEISFCLPMLQSGSLGVKLLIHNLKCYAGMFLIHVSC
jgi:hypothetical protein